MKGKVDDIPDHAQHPQPKSISPSIEFDFEEDGEVARISFAQVVGFGPSIGG